jgi:hypothetical protein
MQRTPAGDARILGLGVKLTDGRLDVCPAHAAGPAQQIPSFHRRRHGDTRGAEHRRCDIRETHGVVMLRGSDAGYRHNQRHPQRRVVEQHAVGPLAVIPETFAVVAGDDHERPVTQRVRIEPRQDARDLRVGIPNLAVVALFECRCPFRRRSKEFARRIVRRMWIVEVDPHKEGARG